MGRRELAFFYQGPMLYPAKSRALLLSILLVNKHSNISSRYQPSCLSVCCTTYVNFDFFIKGSSPPWFVDGFSRKIFIVLHSIIWLNFIVWLPLLLKILGNMCIVIIPCPVCDVINFETIHNSLIKLCFYIIKKSGQKGKYLKNDKSFSHEIKAFFFIFKRLSLK